MNIYIYIEVNFVALNACQQGSVEFWEHLGDFCQGIHELG